MEDNVMYVFLWAVVFMVVVKNHLTVIVALPQTLKEEESTLVYIVINVRSSTQKLLKIVLDLIISILKPTFCQQFTTTLLISVLKSV